jgi:hypothetical protein
VLIGHACRDGYCCLLLRERNESLHMDVVLPVALLAAGITRACRIDTTQSSLEFASATTKHWLHCSFLSVACVDSCCCRYDASANGMLQHPPQRQPSAAAAVSEALAHTSGPVSRYTPQRLGGGSDQGTSLDTLREALMAPALAPLQQQQQGVGGGAGSAGLHAATATPAGAGAAAEPQGMAGIGATSVLGWGGPAGAIGGAGPGGIQAPGGPPGTLMGGSSTDALAAYIDDSFQRAKDFVQRQENQLRDNEFNSLQVGGGQ